MSIPSSWSAIAARSTLSSKVVKKTEIKPTTGKLNLAKEAEASSAKVEREVSPKLAQPEKVVSDLAKASLGEGARKSPIAGVWTRAEPLAARISSKNSLLPTEGARNLSAPAKLGSKEMPKKAVLVQLPKGEPAVSVSKELQPSLQPVSEGLIEKIEEAIDDARKSITTNPKFLGRAASSSNVIGAKGSWSKPLKIVPRVGASTVAASREKKPLKIVPRVGSSAAVESSDEKFLDQGLKNVSFKRGPQEGTAKDLQKPVVKDTPKVTPRLSDSGFSGSGPLGASPVSSKANAKAVERDILLLGDGNFSYTQYLVEKYIKQDSRFATRVLATEYQLKAELRYQDESIITTINRLEKLGVRFEFGVDATKIGKRFSMMKFSRIQWNCPDVAANLDSRLTTKVVNQFFVSAKEVLRADGRIHMALIEPRGFGGKITYIGYKYGLADASIKNGYVPLKRLPFEDKGAYTHKKTSQGCAASTATVLNEYVFQVRGRSVKGTDYLVTSRFFEPFGSRGKGTRESKIINVDLLECYLDDDVSSMGVLSPTEIEERDRSLVSVSPKSSIESSGRGSSAAASLESEGWQIYSPKRSGSKS